MTEKNPSSKYGIEVKKKLLELGITQKQFAERIGVGENYLTMILTGRRSGKKYRDKMQQVLAEEQQRSIQESQMHRKLREATE